MLPCNALKHNLNNFSNLFFCLRKKFPQGVCGLATTYISNLRPRRPHRPCDPGVRVTLCCGCTELSRHTCLLPVSESPNQPTLQVLSQPNIVTQTER